MTLLSVDDVVGWLDDPEAFYVGIAALRDSRARHLNLAVLARFHRPRRQRIPRSWISHQERDFTLATY